MNPGAPVIASSPSHRRSFGLGGPEAPAPPLVAEGYFHAQPFADASFDFEFSNDVDHALYPGRFAAEIQRTLRPGGVAVLHVAVHRRGDKYSANDILGLDGVVALFNHSHLLRVSKIDAFGLDTELILRKNHHLWQHLFQVFSIKRIVANLTLRES